MSNAENPVGLEDHIQIPAACRDKLSPVWDMSQERSFIENLLNQRFNFFMIVFALVAKGAFDSRQQWERSLALCIGVVISGFLWAVLWRTQEKLDIILDDLREDKSHPVYIVDSRASSTGSRRHVIGYGLPTICWVILTLGLILSLYGHLPVATKN